MTIEGRMKNVFNKINCCCRLSVCTVITPAMPERVVCHPLDSRPRILYDLAGVSRSVIIS